MRYSWRTYCSYWSLFRQCVTSLMRRSPSRNVPRALRRPTDRRSGGKPQTDGRRRKIPRVRSWTAALSMPPSARVIRAIPSCSARSSPRSRMSERRSVRSVNWSGVTESKTDGPDDAVVSCAAAVVLRAITPRAAPRSARLTSHFSIIDEFSSRLAKRRQQRLGRLRALESESILDPVDAVRLMVNTAITNALRAGVEHGLDQRTKSRHIGRSHAEQRVCILAEPVELRRSALAPAPRAIGERLELRGRKLGQQVRVEPRNELAGPVGRGQAALESPPCVSGRGARRRPGKIGEPERGDEDVEDHRERRGHGKAHTGSEPDAGREKDVDRVLAILERVSKAHGGHDARQAEREWNAVLDEDDDAGDDDRQEQERMDDGLAEAATLVSEGIDPRDWQRESGGGDHRDGRRKPGPHLAGHPGKPAIRRPPWLEQLAQRQWREPSHGERDRQRDHRIVRDDAERNADPDVADATGRPGRPSSGHALPSSGVNGAILWVVRAKREGRIQATAPRAAPRRKRRTSPPARRSRPSPSRAPRSAPWTPRTACAPFRASPPRDRSRRSLHDRQRPHWRSRARAACMGPRS